MPACQLAIAAGERHLRDLVDGQKRRGLIWQPAKAVHVCEFFPLLRHSKGEWARTPLELGLWQKFVIGSVYGWKRRDGTRRFRVVYQEHPKKNGKSTQLAGVSLYALTSDDEPGAEVYTAATKKDQARIIFGEAHRMVGQSPLLSATVARFKLALAVDATFSKFEPLSSDENTIDGLNPHFVAIDELHRHKNRAVLGVMDNAQGSRRQPLLWIITTAGDDDPESVYSQESAFYRNVALGAVEEDAAFAFITTIDADDRWDDPRAWAKANPNLGVSVKRDDLQRLATKAARSPSSLIEFKRLRLNVVTSAANSEIDMAVWRKNTEAPPDPIAALRWRAEREASMKGRPCYGGLDLSSTTDIAAWVKLFPPIAGERRWTILPRFWVPSSNIADRSDRDKVQYQRWIDAGLIEATPGDVVDHGEIERSVMADRAEYRLLSVAFDPWNAAQLSTNLLGGGVQMVQFIQGLRSYTGPTKELERMLLQFLIEHLNDPVLMWMAANLKTNRDKNLNRMPDKKRSTGRIDGMTALIMAIGRSMLQEHSVYETRGLRQL